MVVMRVAMNLEQLLQPVPGGIGRYTARLATLLPRLCPDTEVVGVVARHPTEAVEGLTRQLGLARRPEVMPLPRPLLYDAWNVLGRPRLPAGADVVHAPSLAVPPAGGAALVVTVHDAASLVHPETYSRRGRWFHSRGLAAAARRADLVVTPSRAAAEEVCAHSDIAPETVRVVPQGVDPVEVDDADVARVRRRHRLADRPYVLWVGTQEPRKNLGLLVEAFARVVAGHDPPHRLAVVGPAGWLHRPARALPGSADLGERLRVVGPVPEDDLHALYRGADVFGFPSLHEGFGLPVLEAMAQGTAVLCSDAAALREVAAGAAVAAPPEPEAWAVALATLLSDAELRRRLGEEGRARAAGLTWERCVVATRAVYEEARGLRGR